MPIVSPLQAVDLLLNDHVVAVPTETVYGLAGCISSPDALKRIFEVKERPLFDPLIVHVKDQLQAKSLAKEWPTVIDHLTRQFWPGPLTVVVPRVDHLNPLITSGLETVGLRAPSHPIAQEILHKLEGPFAAPSANLFGRTSPTRAEHVLQEFKNQIAVVDGGPSEVGLESTVVRLTSPDLLEILRPGGVSEEQLRLALDPDFLHVQVRRATSHASPGHLEHHYQPLIPLLIAHFKKTDDNKKLLSQKRSVNINELYDLVLSSDPRLAARELYHQLFILSQKQKGEIVYWAGPEWVKAEWSALVDRLTRAATLQLHQF